MYSSSLTSDEVNGFFRSCLDWNDDSAAQRLCEKAEQMEKGAPREVFATLIQILPANTAVKKIGHVANPVAADVYVRTEFDGEID